MLGQCKAGARNLVASGRMGGGVEGGSAASLLASDAGVGGGGETPLGKPNAFGWTAAEGTSRNL